jgi:23S rRNA (adenine2503-C2)-methyltransferase
MNQAVDLNLLYLPTLEIVSSNGDDNVAQVFVARTRQGDDKSLIEFVDGLDTRFPREKKWIINISTQYGCPIGCRFCDAGHTFHGNLESAHMLAQVHAVLQRHPDMANKCEKLKVHFARMGEPALNDNVLEVLQALPGFTEAPGLWACVPTTAPWGRTAWFEDLLDIKNDFYRGRFQLQFSVNTTDMDVRRRLMPARLNDLDWMAAYTMRFVKPGDRTVVLNFALAEGTPFDVEAITGRFAPETVCVKLTPLNPTQTGHEQGLTTILRTDAQKRLDDAVEALTQAGFSVVISVGDGREDSIGSNCGQSVRRIRELRT